MAAPPSLWYLLPLEVWGWVGNELLISILFKLLGNFLLSAETIALQSAIHLFGLCENF